MSKQRAIAAAVFVFAIVGVSWIFTQRTSAGPALTTEDYIEIQQLYARYSFAIDSGDAEAYAATFVPDGSFAGSRRKITGHDALVAFVNNYRDVTKGTRQRHWISNLLINPTPEGASGAAYLLMVDVSVRPPVIVEAMKYNDRLVKTALGWRFKEKAPKAEGATADPPKP